MIGALPEQPDVYLALMHSGVTLAPIAGGDRRSELDAYRPVRDCNRIQRY